MSKFPNLWLVDKPTLQYYFKIISSSIVSYGWHINTFKYDKRLVSIGTKELLIESGRNREDIFRIGINLPVLTEYTLMISYYY